ncbi:type I phosphomannose isomerase catalytic subunit [Cerasicoccus arenae]|uniref:Mannose-6-phosphate isomerase n=1 Tax=Cerasicoccus arenae TaxID=424488 RepID=A0A8J3GDT4_9BACT|nr:type I phosphomannose isomerase catalytic subunit [Cerasicoccus arenae]MBK1858810.1 class I mannose-6-phosphate isomerase [Cerasicoccus arenae]GHC04465.1 mannose-6-phosphate isomerase [Cerasicoccus arenae]
MRFISFKPIYQQRVWGGRGLEAKLGRSLPDDQPYGESWEIVDRPEAQSVLHGAELSGLTLRAALEKHATELMGPDWNSQTPFPILVKWLDCQERLSLQVHPPADIAPSLGGEPKTENWYVADSEPSAGLIVGLKKGATREEFERRLADGSLEECVHRMKVSPGESMFVRSGRIHAIDGGNLILEIQQNSDTTYRVYDWGRVGLDGQPRQLHVEESLQCINFEDFEPETIKPAPGEQTLVESEIFNLTKRELRAGERLEFSANEQPRLLSVVQGSVRDLEDGAKVPTGANVLLPYESAFTFVAAKDSVVLITDGFAHG